MSEKCKTCDGTGSVPAEVETAEGPMPCPYVGAPCPDCSPMPEKVKMVRESVYRELVEALEACLELEQEKANRHGYSDCCCMSWSRSTESAYENGACPHQMARAALAKAEGLS